MSGRDATFDRDVPNSLVRGLHGADAVEGFFAYLNYKTEARITQTPANVGITADSLARQIERIELIADQDGDLQVYLFELKSVTVAATQGIARAFRFRRGNYLVVLTSDYERLDFVFLERTQPQGDTGTIGQRHAGVLPRTLSVDRRSPERRHLRILRRLTYTESDPFYQYEKIRAAYDVAYWSEEHFDNRALFSDYYLLHRLPEEPEWREDPTPAYRTLTDRYASARARWDGKPEEELRRELMVPVLETMGFRCEETRGVKGDVAVPDYLLHGLNGSPALVACNVYPWGRSLDSPDDSRDKDTPEENPGAVAVSLLDRGDAEWAIVTNGRSWRLYARCAHNKATNFYEVDLEDVLARDDPAESFRYFWLIFRRQAFEPVPVEPVEAQAEPRPRCFLDRLFEGSQEYAKQLGERLKDRVFEHIFPHFADGFIEHICQVRRVKRADLSQDELDAVFQGTLTFLYRLLFLLYAESRDLLPVKEYHGYFQASLSRVKAEVAEALGDQEHALAATCGRRYRTDSYDLYDRLAELFRIIDKGDPSLNVPTYNGGLFLTQVPDDDTTAEAVNARFLCDHNIPDRYLALGLDLLARDEDEKKLKLVFIDYKSLGVRQLGSIYEGLLEFKLRVAGERLAVVKVKGKEVYKPVRDLTAAERKGWDRAMARAERKDDLFAEAAAAPVVKKGAVYLENDKSERKATGSYYTPDHIVKYIVEHAVGPVLDGKFDAVRPALRDAQKKQREFAKRQQALARQGLKQEPASKAALIGREVVPELFDIKVLDPAMGSGHFLVEAVDFITDGMLDFLNAFPRNPVTAFLAETRRTILAQMAEAGITIDDRRLTDVNLLKRHILKRCVYGVDLNPMAVELAKVSLWLDCFTLGAPLSFLDHHLRCGNSLIGVTVAEVQGALKQQRGLFGLEWTGLLLATDMMRQIGEMPDITSAQVAESRHAYRCASDALWPFKRILDLYTSRWFGNEPATTGRGKKKQVEDHVLDFLNSPEAKGFLEAVEREAERLELPRDHPQVFEATLATLRPNDGELVATALAAVEGKRFFHWELEFPEVFYGPRTGSTQAIGRVESAGFDAVVGNPPYVRQEALKLVKEYLHGHYTAFHSAADTYVYFCERGTGLLRRGGYLCYIVSSSFLRTSYGEPLRRYLVDAMGVLSLVDFGGLRAFSSAQDTYVCIPLICKGPQLPEVQVCRVDTLEDPSLTAYVAMHEYQIPSQSLGPEAWHLDDPARQAVFEKVAAQGLPLGQFVRHRIYSGIKTGLNEAFVIGEEDRAAILRRSSPSASVIKPFLGGQDIRRYFTRKSGRFLIALPCGWTRKQMGGAGQIGERQAWAWLADHHPGLTEHLDPYQDAARRRQDQGGFWWELRSCDYYDVLNGPKIIYPDIAKHPRFHMDQSGVFLGNTAYCLGSDDYYLLGLLNSKLAWFAVSCVSIPFGTRAGEYRYRMIYQYMEQVPIRRPGASGSRDGRTCDEIGRVARRLAELHALRDDDEVVPTNADEIARLDHQIDLLVYGLHDLTEEEIAIVERGR